MLREINGIAAVLGFHEGWTIREKKTKKGSMGTKMKKKLKG